MKFIFVFLYGILLFFIGFFIHSSAFLPFPLRHWVNPLSGLWWKSLVDDKEKKECTNSEPCLLTREKNKIFYVYDSHGILHIYTRKSEDLYWAQGYLTARERLFQMDLQTRVASGRLAEWIGEEGLSSDQFFVRLGLSRAVEESVQALKEDALTAVAAQSYVEGVNEWIRQKSLLQDWPLEYFLIDQKPIRWDLKRIASLMKFMDFQLSGISYDLQLTNLIQHFTWKKMSLFFEEGEEDEFPIMTSLSSSQVNSSSGKKTSIEKSQISQFLKLKPFPIENFKSIFTQFPSPLLRPPEGQGSNNWALWGKKSKSGFPMMATDPHLSYTQPNLFFEIQLHSLDTGNTYGMSLPGIPGILIGFNSFLSWSFTNGYTDVWDWIDFPSDKEYSRYQSKDGWKDLKKEEILIPVKKKATGKDFFSFKWGYKENYYKEQILSTEFGPVVDQKSSRVLVSHWLAAQKSLELKSFLLLNRAQSRSDCEASFKGYKTPSQNLICLDRQSASLTQVGFLPQRRWNEGMTVLDGQSFKPLNPLSEGLRPYQLNPVRGFIYSANQRPLPKIYSQGWRYGTPYRAARIEQILMQNKEFSPKDFFDIQNDLKDIFLMKLFDEIIFPHWPESLQKSVLHSELQNLKKENYELTIGSVSAQKALMVWGEIKNDFCGLFDFRKKPLLNKTFEKEIKVKRKNKISQNPCPPDQKIFIFLKKWSQKTLTKEGEFWVEQLRDGKMTADLFSFEEYLEKILFSLGKSPGLNEQDNKIKNQALRIPFILPLKGWKTVTEQGARGSQRTIYAHTGRQGPVFQMVVHLSDPIEAWVSRPGLNNGLPKQKDWSEQIQKWIRSEYRRVEYLNKEFWVKKK